MTAFINRLSSSRALINWLKTVDGTGSGLDADTVDGLHAESGTYVPTLTNATNVAASTAVLSRYGRIGEFVAVTGYCEIDPTSAAGTATELGMSIPIASNFPGQMQLAGIGVSYATGQFASIRSDGTNDRATFDFLCTNAANAGWRFVFAYTVIG